jgi:hypothetical protein
VKVARADVESPLRGPLRAFFGPLIEGRTYRSLAYLLLGLPLGVAYFSFVLTMLALGFGLAITVVGLPILAATLRLARGLTALDMRLTEGLLHLEMPRVPIVTSSRHGLRRYFGDRDAWVDAAYLLLRLPLGVIDFTIAVSVVGSALFLVSLPVVVAAGATTLTVGAWSVNSQARAWMLVPGGVLLLLVSPHVIKGVASISARLPHAMIGRIDYSHLRSDVLAMLRPDVEQTGPAVLDQLRLYRGASADCTARKVFVVLSELEHDGLARRQDDSPFDRYSLSPEGELASASAARLAS